MTIGTGRTGLKYGADGESARATRSGRGVVTIGTERTGLEYDARGDGMSAASAVTRGAKRKRIAAFAADKRATAPVAPDKKPDKAGITERQLAAIWRGRRFPPGALVTRQGVPVTVIYQGRDGRGPGPDFRGAVIAGPSALPVRGDIELHVLSSSFRAHGHDGDPAYAGVVLHVVFEDDTGVDTPLPGGRTAPVIALGPWVAARAGELERWLAQPLLWREPCHGAVMRMGTDRAGAALDAEGDRRFEEKAARIGARAGEAGLEQALYEGLLEAMGYGGNAPAMLALARLLPWRLLSAFLPGSPATSRHADTAHVDAMPRGRRIGGEPQADQTDTDTAHVDAMPCGRRIGGEPQAEQPDTDTAHVDAMPCGRRIGGEPQADQTDADAADDRSQRRIEAVLLGSGGLLPSQRGHRGPLDPYVAALEAEFARGQNMLSQRGQRGPLEPYVEDLEGKLAHRHEMPSQRGQRGPLEPYVEDLGKLAHRQEMPSRRGQRGPLEPYVEDLEGKLAHRHEVPSRSGQRGPLEPCVEGLERQSAPRQNTLWKLWGIRPENAPARRIAGAAALLRSLGSPSAAIAIVDARSLSEVIGPLSAVASGYWRTHHDVCAGPCRLPAAFIGRSRALEIAINVVLPAAAAGGDPVIAAQARGLYAKLPRPASYGRTRFIENALASSGARVPVNARRAQGLLALNRDWCTQDGCGRCSLSAGIDLSVEPAD